MLSVFRHKITIIVTLNSHYYFPSVLFLHISVEMLTANNLSLNAIPLFTFSSYLCFMRPITNIASLLCYEV